MGDGYAARAYKLCGKGATGKEEQRSWAGADEMYESMDSRPGPFPRARVHCKFAIFAECRSMLCFGIGFDTGKGKSRRGTVFGQNAFWCSRLRRAEEGKKFEKIAACFLATPWILWILNSDGGNCSMGGGGGHGIHGISFCWGERLPNLTECTLRGDNWMGWKMRGRDVFGWVKMAGTRMANFPLCSLNQNCNKTKVMNRILAMAKVFLLPHSVGIYLSHILSLFSCGSCNLFNYFNGIFLLSICRYYGAFVAG